MNLQKKLSEIANFLSGWRIDQRSNDRVGIHYLLGPNHTKISCRSIKDRVHFYACSPEMKNSYYRGWDPCVLDNFPDFNYKITVAKSRKPRAIASDLNRRMIKDYLKVHEFSNQKIAMEVKSKELLVQVTKLAARLLNGKFCTRDPLSSHREIWFDGGNVEISSPGKFHFQYTTSYEKGLKLAGILKDQL